MNNYSIGIDLGGTKIIGGIVNIQSGEVIYSVKKKTKKDMGSEFIIFRVINIVEDILSNSLIPKSEIISIGIGLAGQVDREKGILLSAPNLDCTNLNFKKILEEKFCIPSFIANDVEVATLGELKFGRGKNCKNFVCIFVGTGIGSGIVIDGKLYQGYTGTAGEIGHIIVSSGGRACGCGGNGCLEAYASKTAIEQKIKGAIKKGQKTVITEFVKNNEPIRSKHLKKAIELKDKLVFECVDEATEYLSSGIAGVINFFNPELVILGGGLIEAIESFFECTKRKTISKCLPSPSKNIKIEKAELGDFSGVVGASLLSIYRNI